MVNDKALNIKIPEKLYNDLKEVAERKHISLASLVRMACSEYLEAGCVSGPIERDDIDKIFNSLPSE